MEMNLTAEELGVKFAEKLGAKNIAELRKKTASQIVKEYQYWLKEQNPRFLPIVDGYAVPEREFDIIKKIKQKLKISIY